MELEQIKIFAVVAECGSFKKAADRLYVSHSTVSRSVSALERELGTFLFRRDCRGVTLTEAGKELLQGGIRLLAEAVELERRILEKGEQICADTPKPSG
jgi:LysR family nitrogen assimilation transcriptional regulator